MAGKEVAGIPHLATIGRRLMGVEKSSLAHGGIYVIESELSDRIQGSEDIDTMRNWLTYIKRVREINRGLGRAARSDVLVEESDLLLIHATIDGAREATFAHGKNFTQHPSYQNYLESEQTTEEEAQQEWFYESKPFLIRARTHPVGNNWGRLFFNLEADEVRIYFGFDFDNAVGIRISSLDANQERHGYGTGILPLEQMTKEEASIATYCIDWYTEQASEEPQR